MISLLLIFTIIATRALGDGVELARNNVVVVHSSSRSGGSNFDKLNFRRGIGRCSSSFGKKKATAARRSRRKERVSPMLRGLIIISDYAERFDFNELRSLLGAT